MEPRLHSEFKVQRSLHRGSPQRALQFCFIPCCHRFYQSQAHNSSPLLSTIASWLAFLVSVYFNPDLNLTLFLHLQRVPGGLDRGYRLSRNLSRSSIICPYPTFASTQPAFLSERVDHPIGLRIYEAHLLELFANICASQHIWFIFISQALDTVSCTWQELDTLNKGL